ncbi:helix-turn-helix domain-containing protein [Bacillus manliponensis]|uniref:helix-turn-helix domain-containing protein n=1 Tax=Bacillus manliponensis TaxID=574376 RepID=UPI003516B9A5
MTRWINVQEAMEILEEHYIKVSYKTFTDWLRKLEIPAIPSENRKEGWAIREEDLFGFIEKKRPGLRQILEEYHHLIQDVKQVKEYMNGKEKSIHNDDVEFLYDAMNAIWGEIEELREQNESVTKLYKQIIADNSLLGKKEKRIYKKAKAEKNSEVLLKEEVLKLDEETFQRLLKAKFKNLFPNQEYSLEEKEPKLYQVFCDLVFPVKDKHLGIIKQGNEYVYQRTEEKSPQVNRIYNKIIGELLGNLEEEQENDDLKQEEEEQIPQNDNGPTEDTELNNQGAG